MSLSQHLAELRLRRQTRRTFLREGVAGLGGLWLATQQSTAATAPAAIDPSAPLAPRTPHHPAKAKRVIFLHMAGAPSQFELFEHKPELKRLDGQPCPQSLLEGRRFAFLRGTPLLLGPRYAFEQAGESGQWLSDRLPHFRRVVDHACFVRTMTTDQFNHAPAQLLMHTGSARGGSAALGAWTTYGLGSENQDLPGFVVLASGGRDPSVGQAGWGSGFLPSVYQGVQCRSEGDPVLFLSNPDGVDQSLRRRVVDAINRVNQQTHQEWGDPETLTRIAQYEMACRMQLEAASALDLSDESADTIERYGAEPGVESFANNCLLARRLVERDVRFVQLFDWGWDMHGNGEPFSLGPGMTKKARLIDRPIAALIEDLDQRGLLEETLVVFTGEFGRTPMRENRAGLEMSHYGRDHHPYAFTLWMAGGGVRAGHSHGETDEIGFSPVTTPVRVRDLHATILHLLGFDHRRLTYPHRGLDEKLTTVEEACVVKELIA